MTLLQITSPAAQQGSGLHASSLGFHDGGDVPPGWCCLVGDDDDHHRRHGALHNRHGIPHCVIRVTSAPPAEAARQAGLPTRTNTASSPATSPQAGLPGRFQRFLRRRFAPTSRRHRPWEHPYVKAGSLGRVHG
jgi:hypothetical protein